MKVWLAIGAFSGAVSVALGAFAAHGLGDDPYAAGLVDKAARYQMYHALALVAVAWLSQAWPGRLVTAAGLAFVAGTLLFCGALYAIGLGGLRAGMVAPFGGSAFILGWMLLAVHALRLRHKTRGPV
ncbi:DUF423 domain-containing protein [Telmatospirillum sp. J64-1]|uniref:DUF423 domain-containing protein n=1 Tax=Telmatospirillum sp. J64-1 TaxID=2502183 RepID=UPI00115E4623|nr:DUF423 domain-containing protein [Telmatospirillum sp. J64-1]